MSTTRRIAVAIVSLCVLTVLTTALVLWDKGYRVYVIHTGSMTPTYSPGDIVIDGPPSGHYRAGEVLTFRHSSTATDVVTHRVTGVTAAGLIHTKGDANRTADVWEIRPNQVQGHALFSVRDLGYLAVFLKQPAGIGSLATAILALVLLWGLFFPPGAETEDDADGDTDAERDAETGAEPDPSDSGARTASTGPLVMVRSAAGAAQGRPRRAPRQYVSRHSSRCVPAIR